MGEGLLVALLAAGRGTRFGGGKLDALCAGKPLGSWAIQAVERAGLAPGVIVIGPDVPRFAPAAEGWNLVTNPGPERGLGSSLALAAEEAVRRDADGLLVLLADMPLVPSELLRELAQSAAPAAFSHGGKPGVPTLFGRQHYLALARREGDRGAASLLARMTDLTLIAAPEQALIDVDTQEALERTERVLSRT